MTGFVALELRRSLRDVRYLVIAVAMPIGLYLLFTGLFGSTASERSDCRNRWS
jgi:ABC-2 type transport system permease protein